ncbi:MAG: hypothetical protein K2Q17_14510 [Nitrospiraceae bacterium]|jgi:hypothetical protein|uniref:hypothetical protein n=1 Tax=Nitrospira cf. moscoviensis SBR1015 TaxID=96242 RepID=UPI000A0D1FA9|nr:hypothetical protein [Nitrospira cf. moscoviensis SBR1015]MBY0248872.1 hypothetical protein [Nitrospiraceae bacterium]OQW31735.1 MAG: hypothetical protein A4E20_14620 [Nitrospira sp. SG-bin2]
MKSTYRAAFIVPIGANKILGEDGWEFQTQKRITVVAKEFLISALKLRFLESYLGIDAYIGDNIKMSVIYDDACQIESIAFQMYSDSVTVLSKAFIAGKLSNESELFIP